MWTQKVRVLPSDGFDLVSLWDMRDFVSPAHSAMLVLGVGKVREESFGISFWSKRQFCGRSDTVLLSSFLCFFTFCRCKDACILNIQNLLKSPVPQSATPFSWFPIEDKSLRRADTPSSWTFACHFVQPSA